MILEIKTLAGTLGSFTMNVGDTLETLVEMIAPPKTNMVHLKMMVSKAGISSSSGFIFRFHVSFPGCKQDGNKAVFPGRGWQVALVLGPFWSLMLV